MKPSWLEFVVDVSACSAVLTSATGKLAPAFAFICQAMFEEHE
jgi:hypothetical protein